MLRNVKAGPEGSGLLVIANQKEHTVLVVDPDDRRELARVVVGVNGHEVMVSKDGRFAYVPIYGNSGVGRPGTDGSTIDVVDFSKPSSEPRFHVVDMASGYVDSYRVAHGRGSDPAHSGYLERFSNDFGSYATSNGAYVTGDYYDGKYGLSLRVRGLDWSNNNAEARAIVIHNAWYAEDDMIPLHGKLGRSEGCFAMSRENQYAVMRRLAGGRMIYADKLA